MARDPKQLRNNWQRKLGDIVLELNNDQLKEISKYYNSLDNKESGDIDSRLMMGYNDTVLHDMANKFAKENKTSKLPKIKRKRGRPLKNKKVKTPNVLTSPEALVKALLDVDVNVQDVEKQSIEDKNISIDDVVGENDPSSIVEGVTPKYDFDEFVEEVEQKISPEKLFDNQKDTIKEKTVIVKDSLDKDKFKSEILKGVESLVSQLKGDKEQSTKVLPKNDIITQYKEVEKIVEVIPEKDDNKKLFEGIDNLLQDIRGEGKPQEKSEKKEKKSQIVDKESITDNIDIALEKIKEYKKLSSSTSTEKVVEEVEPEDQDAFKDLDELLSDVKNDTPSIKPTEEVEPEDEGTFDKLDELLSDVKNDTPSIKPTEEVEPEDQDAFQDLDDLLSDVKKDTLSPEPSEEVETEDEIAFDKLDELLSDVKKDTPSLKPVEEVEPEDQDAFQDLDDVLKDVREAKSSDEKKEEQVEPEDENAYEDLDDLIKDVREIKSSDEKKEQVEPVDKSAFEKLDALLTEVRDDTDTLKPRDTDETTDDESDGEDEITQIENILVEVKKSIEQNQTIQNTKLENIENIVKEIREKDEGKSDEDKILEDIEELLIEIREDKKDEEGETTENDDEEVADSIDGMNETLEGIDSLLKDILGQEKEEDEREKTEAQKGRQKQEEAEAEKSTKKNVFGALKKIKPPKMGFLERIKNFFTNILLGSVVVKLLNWVSDPKNQETIDGVLDFVTNHMDKILIGLATLVGLNIGLKILTFLKLVVPLMSGLLGGIKGLLGTLIPKVVAPLATSPLGVAAAVTFLATGSSRRTPGQDQMGMVRQYAFKNGEEKLEFDRYLQKSITENPEYKKASESVDANPDDPEVKKNFEDTRDRLMGEATLKYFEENPEKMKEVALTSDERLLDVLPLSDQSKEEIKKLRSSFKESQNDIMKNQKYEMELLNKKLYELVDPRTMQPKRKEDKEEVDKIRSLIEDTKNDYKSQTSEAYTIMSSGYDDLKAGFLPGRRPTNTSPTSTSQSGSKPEPPVVSAIDKVIPTSSEPTGVKKVIIGAGHAPSPENAAKGLPLGSDNRPVQGTADDNAERNNPDPNYRPTGVTESAATKQVVDALKMMVKDRGLEDKIGFEDIYSYDGLTEVPRKVEGKEGQQYVDLHFDARQFGKEGVLPSRNESATDKSLMKEFGRYSPDFNPSKKGVTSAGGTLVELGRIDDPKIRGLLEEVKRGEIGPETNKMAERVLRGILPSIESSPQKPKTKASLPESKDMKTSMKIPSPPSDSVTIAGLPMGGMGGNGQKQLSSSSQAGQKGIQAFSPVDQNNMTIASVKSIYNVII